MSGRMRTHHCGMIGRHKVHGGGLSVVRGYGRVWYGMVGWHDRPRVSVWWSSEWGEAGESAAPSRAPVPPSPPRDAQSSPVFAHNKTLSSRSDSVVRTTLLKSGWVEQKDYQQHEKNKKLIAIFIMTWVKEKPKLDQTTFLGKRLLPRVVMLLTIPVWHLPLRQSSELVIFWGKSGRQ